MDTVHECDRQTDGQIDGRTDRITITNTVQTASHGKNDKLKQKTRNSTRFIGLLAVSTRPPDGVVLTLAGLCKEFY